MWEKVSRGSDLSEANREIFLESYCLGSSMRDEWVLTSEER